MSHILGQLWVFGHFAVNNLFPGYGDNCPRYWDIYWTVSHGYRSYHKKSVFAASADQSDELKLNSADMPKVSSLTF
jgi:hypothetical protein